MNSSEFYIPLNLPEIKDELPIDLTDRLASFRAQNTTNGFIDFCNYQFPAVITNTFSKIGLTPSYRKTEFFYQPKLEKHSIHLDGDPKNPEFFRAIAINWVWGGKTVMEWYLHSPQIVPNRNESVPGHFYLELDPADCTLAHKAVLTGANLVNITKFHSVRNASINSNRYCLSVCPEEDISWEEITDLCCKHGLVRE